MQLYEARDLPTELLELISQMESQQIPLDVKSYELALSCHQRVNTWQNFR
jgi:hypothetical protein